MCRVEGEGQRGPDAILQLRVGFESLEALEEVAKDRVGHYICLTNVHFSFLYDERANKLYHRYCPFRPRI